MPKEFLKYKTSKGDSASAFPTQLEFFPIVNRM